VADFVSGLYTIGEHDLVRIFNLTCIQPPAPPQPNSVERINGVTYAGDQVFDPSTGRSAGFIAAAGVDGSNNNQPTAGMPQGLGSIRLASQNTGAGRTQMANSAPTSFRFRPPDAACNQVAGTAVRSSNCPTCRTCGTRR
jgi:hypothetical protein